MYLFLYISTSFIEYIAAFYLMFRLFGFKLKWQIAEVLFISTLLTFLSYTLKHGFDLDWLNPFMQVIAVIVMLWMIMKVAFFYAIVMATAFIIHLINQFLVFELFYYLGAISETITFAEAIWVVLTASGVTMLMGWILHLMPQWQFTFISMNPSVRLKINGQNVWIVLLILFQAIAAGGLYAYSIAGEMGLFSIGTKVALVGALYILYQLQKLDERV